MIEPIYFDPLNLCKECRKGELYLVDKDTTISRLNALGQNEQSHLIKSETYLQCNLCGTKFDYINKGNLIYPLSPLTKEIMQEVQKRKREDSICKHMDNPLTKY